MSSATLSPTLGDAVAENLLKRFADLGILDKQPLVPIPSEKPAIISVAPAMQVNAHAEEAMLAQAIANQRYYVEQAAKTGKPWFHHPKQAFQYSEFVFCTPQMAEELEDHNVDNRNKSLPYIEALARDMLNGRWLQTEESLGIDLYGIFYNGQHRSTALITAARMAEKSGVNFAGVPLYFTFQVPTAARYVEDSGRKRGAKQKLEYLGAGKLTCQTTAVLRALMEGSVRSGRRVTESELGSFLVKHKETLDWVATAMPKTRSDVQAAIAKAALWYGKDKIEPFCKRFRDMVFTENNDPACTLYKYLVQIKGKGGVYGVTVYRKTIFAIEAFLGGRHVSKLYEREKDYFDWLPGWEVPVKV